jgi:hypothetical protein
VLRKKHAVMGAFGNRFGVVPLVLLEVSKASADMYT